MKSLLFLPVLFILFFSSNAQVPLVKSQRSIASGYVSDVFNGMGPMKVLLQARNGNLIVGGTKDSISFDVFLAEIDVNNNIVWSKTYGNRMSREDMLSVEEGIGGGYVILGVASVEGEEVGSLKGGEDAWVIRVDNNGDVLWKKTYGGSADDKANHIEKVGNSGYIMIGETESSDGDLRGVRDPLDGLRQGRIWVARLDVNGNHLWSRVFGGSAIEDVGVIIRHTSDNGFVLGANMASTDFNGSSNHGAWDIWLAKLNSSGSLEWNRCFGGASYEQLSDIEITNDGFLVAGGTMSDDGDVSGFHGDAANNPNYLGDGWVFKVSNAGAIQWQKCIGGTLSEYITDISYTQNGDIIGVGTTASWDGDIPKTRGKEDVMLFRLSNDAKIEWVKTFGGTEDDYGGCILSPKEDEYVVVASVRSTDGDIEGGPGGDHIWFARLGAGSTVKGFVFYDYNSNGLKDANEPPADNIAIAGFKEGFERTTFTRSGQFSLIVDTGSTSIKISPDVRYHTSVPDNVAVEFETYFLQDSISFALQPVADKKDLRISAVPIQPARPGFEVQYLLMYNNAGTTEIESGEVVFVKDKRTELVSSAPVHTREKGDTLFWEYSNLSFGDSASISLHMRIQAPPVVNNGDTLSALAFITPVAGDETPADDSVYIRQIVTGSFDPNDKAEMHAGMITPSQVSQAEYLNYTIRFQNMGTDTAFNIVVRDTLDAGLNWASLEMVGSSHPYYLVIKDGNSLAWEFSNILLPDDKTNEPLSHGYISYRIRPKKNLVLGDKIHNTASIYFDYNLPVITNDAVTEVKEPANPLPLSLLRFNGRCEGNQKVLRWETANETGFNHFVVEGSSDGRLFSVVGKVAAKGSGKSVEQYQFYINNTELFKIGNYFQLKMVDHDGKFEFSPILYVGCATELNAGIRMYPNPARGGHTTLEVNALTNGIAQLVINDANGKQIHLEKVNLVKGINLFFLNQVSYLPAGNYWIGVKSNTRQWVSQLSILQ
ncbi:DUF7619 domain-containing protein [Paracnuella aquatica]|uniref:DUF7619 domain-containing protein n=1 Tax=Paracnuella aquatica TaxID=2268757 RepID=UPI000DEF1099|nr:T9SS type A sorting domain-containing protein [Paracnuella aquatica]RPD49134.1 T9SS C-terminal target domain-containing protein [Paracnuella aquatica]